MYTTNTLILVSGKYIHVKQQFSTSSMVVKYINQLKVSYLNINGINGNCQVFAKQNNYVKSNTYKMYVQNTNY